MGLDFGMQFDYGSPIPGPGEYYGGIKAFDVSGEFDDLREILGAIETDPAAEPLRTLRDVIQEEATARSYVTQRHRALINRKYLRGLSTNEADELKGLEITLDKIDEPYYEAVLTRLSRMKTQRLDIHEAVADVSAGLDQDVSAALDQD
jgi:hypothetical protein